MTHDEFYEAVGALIGVIPEGKAFPYRKRTRWNNRIAGRGRFLGAGIVRVFSDKCIHVQLHNPKLSGTFKSFNDVLERLTDGRSTKLED